MKFTIFTQYFMKTIDKKYTPGPLLSKINSPEDLRHLKKSELTQVCKELRQYIIDIVSEIIIVISIHLVV